MNINPLLNGRHPTNRELQLMRLGYPEYQQRLLSIHKSNPLRYSAIMDGRKRFYQPNWSCPTCLNSERYTRNLACAYCAGQRVRLCFTILEGGLSVYKPTSEERSEMYQQCKQKLIYQRDFNQRLKLLGDIRCGGWEFRCGEFIGKNLSGIQVQISLHEPDAFTVRTLCKQDASFESIWSSVHDHLRIPDTTGRTTGTTN